MSVGLLETAMTKAKRGETHDVADVLDVCEGGRRREVERRSASRRRRTRHAFEAGLRISRSLSVVQRRLVLGREGEGGRASGWRGMSKAS